MPMTALAPEVPTIVLEPIEEAPRLARRFLAERFREWGIADDYVGRLVVCELVTNALLHGEGPIIVRLFLDEADGRPVIEVWDGGEGRPLECLEDHAATGGRGLALMSRLVHAWAVRPLNEGGKIVWAKCNR